ncbi:MAG TPA: hypothetical protein VF748_15115 [Candidatus Acidoferrum sp.]
MKRIWQIEEQTVEDPSTKLRLEFSSVHTDEVNAGNEPPANDGTVMLRLWTSDRTRVATYRFDRSGQFIACEIEAVPGPENVAPVEAGETVQMQTPLDGLPGSAAF